MNNRWTREEESKLLKNVQSGGSYASMAPIFNRSENALEMRVKKIIYENMTNGKTPKNISELLNMNPDKVMQYYYSYKDHVSKENKQIGGNIGNIENNGQLNHFTQNTQYGHNTNNDHNSHNDHNIQTNQPTNNINKISHIDIQDDNSKNKLNKIEKLREQNEKLRLLLENYMLKKKLTEYIKNTGKNNNMLSGILDALLDK